MSVQSYNLEHKLNVRYSIYELWKSNKIEQSVALDFIWDMKKNIGQNA